VRKESRTKEISSVDSAEGVGDMAMMRVRRVPSFWARSMWEAR
jgi:hypothetical protein